MDASNGGDLDQPAQVLAHRCRIRYHRHGSGRPVILLRPPELAASTDAALLDGLAARFRVLVPVAAERTEAGPVAPGVFASAGTEVSDDTPRWLTCFVEGLGVMDGAVVAAGRYRSTAVEVAAALPDQLTRVVLLGASGADEPDYSPRILRVEGDAGRARSALPRVVSFLLREEDSQPP